MGNVFNRVKKFLTTIFLLFLAFFIGQKASAFTYVRTPSDSVVPATVNYDISLSNFSDVGDTCALNPLMAYWGVVIVGGEKIAFSEFTPKTNLTYIFSSFRRDDAGVATSSILPGNYNTAYFVCSKNANGIFAGDFFYNIIIEEGSPIFILDNIPPVITLVGDETIEIVAGGIYTELGASSTDNINGDLTDHIIINNPVDTAVAGTYSVSYNVSDTVGNPAVEVIRTVNVVATDLIKPVINSHADETAEAEDINGAIVTYANPTATDNFDLNVTVSCFPASGSTFALGDTAVTCNATDLAGNEAMPIIFTVTVTIYKRTPSGTNIKNPINITYNLSNVWRGAGGLCEGGTDCNYYWLAFWTPGSAIDSIMDSYYCEEVSCPNGSDNCTLNQDFYLPDGEYTAIILAGSNDEYSTCLEYENYSNYDSFTLEAISNNWDVTIFTVDNTPEAAPTASGGAVMLPPSDAYADWLAQQGEVLGVKIENKIENPTGAEIDQILIDAALIWSKNDQLSAETGKYLSSITAGENLSPDDMNRLNYFIYYGTPTTEFLGAGERAGVLNSYKSTFSKLPATEAEWQDVIKIANGQKPSEESPLAEARAKEMFIKIYGRAADLTDSSDETAVNMMAYGLRPAERNLDDEKKAIEIFNSIFGKNPVTAMEWDAVRAIAYSGAVK